jgi:hypothetical protein
MGANRKEETTMTQAIREELRNRGIYQFDKWKAYYFGKHVKKQKKLLERRRKTE